MRRTKIICTLGPAVDSEEKLRELMLGGMDCARFNFSHGDHREQHTRMERFRKVRDELGLPTAILLDTKGPEIRLRNFINGSAELVEDQLFVLDDSEAPGDGTRVGITCGALGESLETGARVLIDDGKIAMTVEKIEGRSITCRVLNGGAVSNHKGINVPGAEIDMPYISPADRADILFGIGEDVDFIACSFVRSLEDVLAVRRLLEENGGAGVRIISKIENMQGYRNLDGIIKVSDGIMVARGDLGVEIPFQEVPAIQKDIIARCAQAGKIAVTATQMLDSMMHAPRPTRAEVSDVANAIYDGTTVIMLSGETAAGKYPSEAVKTMAAIAEYTEGALDESKVKVKSEAFSKNRIVDGVCQAAGKAADYLGAKAIVTLTSTGRTAFLLAAYWPKCPVIALAVTEKAMRQLSLAHGVLPVRASRQESIDVLLEYAKGRAQETGLVAPGDRIVIVIGSGTTSSSAVDTIKICEL